MPPWIPRFQAFDEAKVFSPWNDTGQLWAGIEATTLLTSLLYVFQPLSCIQILIFPLRGIRFTVNAREGGIFVLPDGASCEDVLSSLLSNDYFRNKPKLVLQVCGFKSQPLSSIMHQ